MLTNTVEGTGRARMACTQDQVPDLASGTDIAVGPGELPNLGLVSLICEMGLAVPASKGMVKIR